MHTMRPIPALLSIGVVSLTCGAASLRAQSGPKPAQSSSAQNSPTTISVDSNLVNLPVTVRDKKGHIVQNLTKADFDLKVDTRPVEVRYFSLETNLPLTLALDVDTSKSVQGMLDAERTASDTFLAQMLTTPSDKAAVLHFDREVELLKDLTANKSALTNALDELGPTPAPNDQDDYDRHRGGTALYDSIYLAAHDVLANKPGRKAIIVLSDGEDRGSQETLREAIEAAERSEVVVYTIYFKGESDSSGMGPHDDGGSPRHHGGMGYPGGGGMGYPGGGGMGYPGGGSPGGGGGSRGGNRRQTQPHIDGKKIMEQIAGETGGDFFEVKKKENYADVYKQIADELRQQYRLGFTPTPSESRAGFHTIQLRTHKGDQYVLTRDGYYGKGEN
jgi:VWFA-related protein